MPAAAVLLSASLLAAAAPDPAARQDKAKLQAGFAGISGALAVALGFTYTHLALNPPDCSAPSPCLTGEGLVAVPMAHFAALPFILSPLAGVHWGRAHAGRQTDPVRSIAAGAGLLAGGLVVAVSSFPMYTTGRDALIWGGTAMVSAGFVMSWVGAGLLTYGLTRRRHGRARFSPTGMATSSGFSFGITGRF